MNKPIHFDSMDLMMVRLPGGRSFTVATFGKIRPKEMRQAFNDVMAKLKSQRQSSRDAETTRKQRIEQRSK